ncbi:hypothetical protein FB639_002171 [Coemansia asiatica]|nr:hypothetical protein FB639_002171 [Coemansia asiatica]
MLHEQWNQKAEAGWQLQHEQKEWQEQRQQQLQDQCKEYQKQEAAQGLLPHCHLWTPKLLHHKLQELAYINCQHMDVELVHCLCCTFGLNPMLILRNWFAGMVCSYVPIPGKGLQCMLLAHSFHILFINKFQMSTWCPYCKEGQLEKLLQVDNLQPERWAEQPIITSHAVLYCPNVNCIGWVDHPITSKSCLHILNCDLAACLNFWHIVNGLQDDGSKPEHFECLTHTDDAPAAAQDGGSEAAGEEHPAQHWHMGNWQLSMVSNDSTINYAPGSARDMGNIQGKCLLVGACCITKLENA